MLARQCVRLRHVLDVHGEVLSEIQLTAAETKGRRARCVVLSQKAQAELRNYIRKQFGLKSLAGVAYDLGHKPLVLSAEAQ